MAMNLVSSLERLKELLLEERLEVHEIRREVHEIRRRLEREEREEREELVSHVTCETSCPSLYCIGTRGDKLKAKGQKEQVKQQIQSLYEKKEYSDLIEGVLIIDNTTSGKGKKEDPSITELPQAIDGFPKILQELKQNVISVSDAIAIGVAYHIPADDVPEVLKFYHELGALFYYPQIEGLKDKVILNPKWFVGVIGKVFLLEKGRNGGKKWYLLRNYGILVQPLYKELWQSSGIDPEEIIELLVHFRLAAQVQTDLYDSRFKQYFLPAVLPGYTGDPNEVQPGYKLRASPVHITFSTGYVPPGFFIRLATAVATNASVELSFDNVKAAPTVGFFDRLAITMKLRLKVEIKGIYRNRVFFSIGLSYFVLTDINEAIQVDVLRYVPEGSHSVPFKTVCQNILKILDECCQKVEGTLILYHSHHADQSSRIMQYLCQCSPSSEVHYIKFEGNAEMQTCSDPVSCRMKRPYSLTINESMWFKGEARDVPQDKHQLQNISPLEEVNVDDVVDDDDDDDATLLIPKVKSTTNYSLRHIIILTIRDLVDIVRVLKAGHFQTIKWFDFGLYLGLIYNDLKVIEINYPRDAERCLRECLAKWLTDDIEATWDKLAIAAGEVGETSVAEYISDSKIRNKRLH